MKKQKVEPKLHMTFENRQELAEAIWSKLLFHTDRIAFIFTEERLTIYVPFKSQVNLGDFDIVVSLMDDWKQYVESPAVKKKGEELDT